MAKNDTCLVSLKTGKKFMFTVYTSYATYLLVHRGLQFSRWAVKLIEMSMYPIVSIIDLSLVLMWSTDWPHCPINETKTIFKGKLLHEKLLVHTLPVWNAIYLPLLISEP